MDKGATVVVASRDPKKVADAVRELGPNARGEVVDLASFASIDAFVTRARSAYPRIDVLVNNAGVFLPPHTKTPEGFEATLGINAIGTAHLTNGLLPLVARSPVGRVVNLSSDTGACEGIAAGSLSRCPRSRCGVAPFAVNYTKPESIRKRLEDVGGEQLGVSNLDAYSESKMLLTLWTEELQARLAAKDSTKREC